MLKENKQLKCKYFGARTPSLFEKTGVNWVVVVVSIRVCPVQTSGLGKILLKLERLNALKI